ncbi:MAG: hypothetical protein U1D30_17210 [Planctomycetota bacterium]
MVGLCGSMFAAYAAYQWYMAPVALETASSLAGAAQAAALPPGDVPPSIRLEPSTSLLDGFPESLTIDDGQRKVTVQYTGKLLRKRSLVLVPVNVYEIAGYIETPAVGQSEMLLENMMAEGSAKLYLLRFLMPLPGRAILNDIHESIVASFGDVDMAKVEADINRFCKQFGRGSSRGDIVYIAWLSGGRVYSGFQTPNEATLVAKDVDLARAIWRIWAGPESENRVNLVERFRQSPQ